MMDYDIRHGRTYMYFHEKPLYPFGFGLSYSTFVYSNLQVSSAQLKSNGENVISVDVRNAGPRSGEEVVQMYVAHVNSTVERPMEELKGFKRIALQPGETKTVRLTLRTTDLAYWNAAKAAFDIEPDQINIRVGASSADIRLQQIVSVSPK
jgi:beta-glucosidase